MTTANDFISLPRILEIEVKNYSLFTKGWSYKIKTGLNLFVGANGLGKTTTTNLIIYGIAGYNSDFELSADYFKTKGTRIEEGAGIPSIIIKFEINDLSFSVTRHLGDQGILELSFGNESYTSDEIDNLDEVYEAKVLNETGFSEINDLVFVLKKFLIREEEGNYLLWDDKGFEQSRLIRLLINQGGFERKYASLATQVKTASSKLRDTQYFRSQIKTRLDLYKEDRAKELSKSKSYGNIETVSKLISSTELDIKNLIKKKQEIEINLQHMTDELKSVKSSLIKADSLIDGLSERISAQELKIFHEIYTNEKVLTAVHKLKHYGICIYCNTQPKKSIRDHIVHVVEDGKACPVCDNPLSGETELIERDSKLISGLNKNSEKIEQLRIERQNLSERLNNASRESNELWKDQQEIDEKIRSLTTRLNDYRLKYVNLTENPEKRVTSFDLSISALEEEIAEKDKEIEGYEEIYKKLKKSFDKLNLTQNKTLKNFETELNNIFKSYAQRYFISDCELELATKKPTKSEVKITSFVPKYGGKRRNYPRDCSTSERIILEYMFRLSLLELYQKLSGTKPFLMLETTEGAFDITNTAQLANYLVSVSDANISLLVVSNFSKPDFLAILCKGIQNKKSRFLNFLDFGKLSKNQLKDKDEYLKIVKGLNLK